MARPINANADATRRRLLDEAVTLFAQRGHGSTSVRDVASAAGVSLAMVHHYFGSKDDLYEACIDAVYAELSAMKGELAAELARDGAIDELLARAVRVGFRFARKHRTAVRLLVRAAVTTGELHPRGHRILTHALDVVSMGVGARLGRPPAELRLPLQSIVFLVARYAAQHEGEMATVVGVPARDKSEAVQAVENHLVRAALDLLSVASSPRVAS